MKNALEFHQVSVRYDRRAPPALNAFTASFPAGMVVGLVGPNGAGKTTAFSVVAGYLKPDSGSVKILGEDGFNPFRLKGRLGLLPQDAALGDRHTPVELLIHLGRLQGLSAMTAQKEADRVLDWVSLTDRRKARIRTLSHGMRRRVAVATALIGRPDLLLLDEPFAGLDPHQAKLLREALLRDSGRRTLVISSHNLDELERICEIVVMLNAGSCERSGPIEEVTGRGSTIRWVLGPGDVSIEELKTLLPGHDFVIADGTLTQVAPPDAALDPASIQVAEFLCQQGVAIREVQRGRGLERAFFETQNRL